MEVALASSLPLSAFANMSCTLADDDAFVLVLGQRLLAHMRSPINISALSSMLSSYAINLDPLLVLQWPEAKRKLVTGSSR